MTVSFSKYPLSGGLLFVFLSIGLLVGCSSQKVVAPTPVPEVPQYHPDTTALPSFRGDVLYTLGLEWEAMFDSTTAKFATPQAAVVRADSLSMGEYIEQRLIDLYPEQAYKGYINKVQQVCEDLLRKSVSQQPSIANAIRSELPEWNSNHPISGGENVSYSRPDSMEVSEPLFLEFTPREQAMWDTLHSIATQAQMVDREQFATLDISLVEEENLLLSILLWRGPQMFYRVLQSKMRAENVAHYYYGEATNSGRPGDAFKHIYVNVLLRSYTSAALAWLVMDVYWENAHPNAPCDHFMDAHNNIVGRNTQYDRFVRLDDSLQCSDMRLWLQWAEQVQHFVQDTTNGDFQNWDKETPSFIVVPAANQVSSQNYIYWDK